MTSPIVKKAAEIPHNNRLLPEKAKPTRPTTKKTVPIVINGRIFVAVSLRPSAYCSDTTMAALTGRTTATTFSAKSPSATTITYCEIQDAKAPPTNDAKNADSVNQNNALSRSSTEGDQTAAFTPSAVAGERFTHVWINTRGSAEQAAASQNGRLMLCITSSVPSGGPTVQPMFSTV